MKYKFSVPMPDSIEKITKLYEINNEIQKSEIKNLYFALPGNCVDKTGFEQLRTFKNKTETIEDYITYFEKTLELGFDFIYLLNSPKPFLVESKLFQTQLEKLDNLINRLKKLGIKKYRLCNPQLIGYLQNNYPDLEVYVSTSLEYKNLKQYSNLLEIYKNVVEIVPACDINKNFKLLKNLKKEYPNIILELMVNEGCINSCPLRIFHHLSSPYFIGGNINIEPELRHIYFPNTCNNFAFKNPFYHLCNPNIIYPWEVEEYAKIGITNFKLVGRNAEQTVKDKYIDYYRSYLLGIDDIKNIEDEPIKIFNHYMKEQDFQQTVKQVKDYLPNIKHFINNGHLCSSICGAECNYCEECAKKIEKIK